MLDSMTNYLRPYLKQLEAEAIYVMREVAAQFERPVLLFSGGKDSILLVHLARRAFYPGRIPFPLLHIDTGHNFQETLEFRDRLVEQMEAKLLVRYVQDSIDQGRVVEETGPTASRNVLQTVTCWTPSPSSRPTRPSAAHGATRRRHAPKNASSRTATASASGIPRTSGPSCGTSTTAASTWASIFASFR